MSLSMDRSDQWFSLFWPIVDLSHSWTSGDFEKEHSPLSLVTGKIINSPSVDKWKHLSFFQHFGAMLSRSCDVVTKSTLRTGHMTHKSTQSAASFLYVSCYGPIGVMFLFSFKKKNKKQCFFQSRVPCRHGPLGCSLCANPRLSGTLKEWSMSLFVGGCTSKIP